METRRILTEFIREKIMGAGAPAELGADDDLLVSGILDSLGAFTLVFFIEERFGIEVPPQDVTIENFSTVAAIEAYVTQRRS